MPLNVTLCLTAGGRPDLLERTLRSLLLYNGEFFDQILITNDRGDNETNSLVGEIAPRATVFNHEKPIGHHKSIDELYHAVKTKCIFHSEDDWLFDPVPFIPSMIDALERIPNISSVSGRQVGDLCLHDAGYVRRFKPPIPVLNGFVRQLDEPKWFGHSFNPALFTKQLWLDVGPFAKYPDEYSINVAVEHTGKTRAFLVPGVYFHIGEGRHMTNVGSQNQTNLARKRCR